MTRLGKILVLLNLALSVGFAAIGFGIYSNHIEWGPGSANEPGALGKKKAELEQLQTSAGVALSRWRTSVDFLNHYYFRLRPANYNWYSQQLRILEGLQPGPIQEIVYVNGRMQLDAQLRPVMKPVAGGLLPRAAALQQRQARENNIQQKLEEIDKLLKVQADLTNEINGGAGQKGFRHLLAENEKTEQNALKEIEDIKPLLYNRLAEGQLLAKRGDWLQQRKQQLERLGRVER
jgi:hypothetical protein